MQTHDAVPAHVSLAAFAQHVHALADVVPSADVRVLKSHVLRVAMRFATTAALQDDTCAHVRWWWHRCIALARRLGGDVPRLEVDVALDDMAGLSATARFMQGGWALFNEDPADFFWHFCGVPLRERDDVPARIQHRFDASEFERISGALRTKFCRHDAFWFRKDGMWDIRDALLRQAFAPPLPEAVTRRDVDTAYALQQVDRRGYATMLDALPPDVKDAVCAAATTAYVSAGRRSSSASSSSASGWTPHHAEASASGEDWGEAADHVRAYAFG